MYQTENQTCLKVPISQKFYYNNVLFWCE